MGDIFKDKRFSSITTNPRFKKIPYKDRKVKIDKRFESMFTDKRFQMKYKVDERGRKINELQSDNYKKYYDLTESSDESDSEESSSEVEDKLKPEKDLIENVNSSSDVGGSTLTDDDIVDKVEKSADPNTEAGVLDQTDTKSISDKKTKKEKAKEAQREINKYVDEIHKMKLNNKVREKLSDISVDYARGIGTLLSGSESSSDEESSEESETEQIEHPWGELDKDAETTEETSQRLAVCNMDWDRVNAKDLMVLFHSFLPPEGSLESVTIYPSEFGLERMAEEELKGPKELVEAKGNLSAASDEDIEEGSSYQREKLREYQLKRLRYYYAVVVCNSKETAATLYSECDGLEYESSATKLDLRFIADDVTFDQKPHDVCTVLPDLQKYRPRLFINTALQQGKVDLTWDETDPNRIDFTRKVLAGEEVDENEINEYLAASSEDDEDTDKAKSESESEDEGKTDQERILKYRALISELQDDNKKRGDLEMEVTWGPDSNTKDDREAGLPEASTSEEESDISSVDENKESKLKKKTPYSKKVDSNSEDERQNAELELLLADDNPEETGKHHFNLKAIQKEEKLSSKKKKWRKNLKNKKYQEEDNFKIDTKDSRFSALYTSHHFNIDPADPHFRKTKAMNELIAEKQKRRKLESS